MWLLPYRMLACGIRIHDATPEMRLYLPIPKGQESEMRRGVACWVVSRLMEMPRLALKSSYSHSCKSARASGVIVMQLPLLHLKV